MGQNPVSDEVLRAFYRQIIHILFAGLRHACDPEESKARVYNPLKGGNRGEGASLRSHTRIIFSAAVVHLGLDSGRYYGGRDRAPHTRGFPQADGFVAADHLSGRLDRLSLRRMTQWIQGRKSAKIGSAAQYQHFLLMLSWLDYRKDTV